MHLEKRGVESLTSEKLKLLEEKDILIDEALNIELKKV